MALTAHLTTKSIVAKRAKALAKLYAQRRQSWIAENPRLGKWKLVGPSNARALLVRCVCDCGVKRVVLLKDLKAGKSKACGTCHTRPVFYATKEDKKLARAINQWKVRCCFPEASNYKYYGARGIKFKFSTINEAVTWVRENLGYTPPGKMIDRIDNNGHYEAGNLRWATRSESMFNRRAWKWSLAARLRHYKLRPKASLRSKRKTRS